MIYERVKAPEACPPGPALHGRYLELADDVSVLGSLLHKLYLDLISSAATLGRHAQALDRMKSAIALLSDGSAAVLPRDELLARLQRLFGELRFIEDDLSAAVETIGRHGLKLQHLDLSMQLLTEILVKVAMAGATQPLAEARLRNLRACCRRSVGFN